MNKKHKFIKKFINEQYSLLGVDKDFTYAIDHENWLKEYRLTEQQAASLWLLGFSMYRKQFKTSYGDTLAEFSDIFNSYSFHVDEQTTTSPDDSLVFHESPESTGSEK